MRKKSGPVELMQPKRKVCPVCNQVSYSKAGVHPQCAQEQADAVRVKRLKAAAKTAKAKADKDNSGKSWYRPCPRCKAQVHLRKAVCECGYELVPKRKPK